MDLRQLSYLVAVGDEGGIRAAARRMQISQPQISQALRRLERELGVELLRRSARGSELTPEGLELLEHGRDILARVGAARAAMQGVRAQRSSTLRVGIVAGHLSAGELLAPILAEFRHARADVALELEDLSFEQVRPLLDGIVDVAIVRAPISHPELMVTPIAQEPRIVMVGATHELAHETSLHVDDILRFPTLPLDAAADWADFWQLNDVRGGPNPDPTVPPVRNVPDSQLAIGTRSVIITSPASLQRLAPNPLIRTIALRGVPATVIAVAHKRRDSRAVVRDFVLAAQRTAERDIGLLEGGTLPSSG
jgi:DNA-binding transcriptional LysR family regulator